MIKYYASYDFNVMFISLAVMLVTFVFNVFLGN